MEDAGGVQNVRPVAAGRAEEHHHAALSVAAAALESFAWGVDPLPNKVLMTGFAKCWVNTQTSYYSSKSLLYQLGT